MFEVQASGLRRNEQRHAKTLKRRGVVQTSPLRGLGLLFLWPAWPAKAPDLDSRSVLPVPSLRALQPQRLLRKRFAFCSQGTAGRGELRNDAQRYSRQGCSWLRAFFTANSAMALTIQVKLSGPTE